MTTTLAQRQVAQGATAGREVSDRDAITAETLCEGCHQPASDVGVLLPVRVTFRSGSVLTAIYCAECIDWARTVIASPEVAQAFHSHIIAIAMPGAA